MPESSKVSIALHGLGLKRNFLHDCFLEYDLSIHLQHDKHYVHHVIFPKLDYDWQKASFNCEWVLFSFFSDIKRTVCCKAPT